MQDMSRHRRRCLRSSGGDILSIPVMLFPIIDLKSDFIFAVYVNVIGVILLAAVLNLHKRN